MQEIAAAKKELRRHFSLLRNELSASVQKQWSKQACNYVIDYMKEQQIRTVMVYVPFRSELDTWPIIEWCWKEQIRVLVPRCNVDAGTMDLYVLSHKEELVEGAYSILEPDPLRCEQSTEPPELVIVPGLAFTAKGERIGYGGGYYDRYYHTVKQLPIKWLGIGYEYQITQNLPMEPNDIWLTLVVTNRGIATS